MQFVWTTFCTRDVFACEPSGASSWRILPDYTRYWSQTCTQNGGNYDNSHYFSLFTRSNMYRFCILTPCTPHMLASFLFAVINTITFVFSSATMKGSSVLYAFMNIILGSMLGMYVMFNGYRILAVAGKVDKTMYKYAGGGNYRDS